jgi:hypothetical protein
LSIATQLAQQSPEKFTQSIPQEVQEAMALSEQSNTLLEAVQTGSHVETEINTTVPSSTAVLTYSSINFILSSLVLN